MDKDELKELIKVGDYESVLKCDQLRKQQKEGNVFKNFIEGDIYFPPTYKYDLFSDDYDTSEKCRAPAWTDRVLWKRRQQAPETEANPGRLVHYGRAELKQSDHRPVIAVIDIEARQIDTERRQEVFYQVIGDLGPPDGTIIVHCEGDAENEDGGVFDDNLMMALLQELSHIGEVVLVRFVADTMWITFQDGQCALQAAAKKSVQVDIKKIVLSWIDLNCLVGTGHDSAFNLKNTELGPASQRRDRFMFQQHHSSVYPAA